MQHIKFRILDKEAMVPDEFPKPRKLYLFKSAFGLGWMARQDGNTKQPELSGKDLEDYQRGYRWQDKARKKSVNVWGKEIERG